MAAWWNLENSHVTMAITSTFSFRNQKLFFFLLALVTECVYSSGGATQESLLGQIGGTVTFRCPVEAKKVKMLFFQRGLSFVNGFFVSRNISNLMFWPNTQMDEKNMIITMHSLNVSHEGMYECIIEYDNDPQTYTTNIHLRVTGNYSKPKVTVLQHNNNYWTVMCSSYGGYPSSKVIWNTSDGRTVKVLNSTDIPDPVTLTINSSSTAIINCSSDEIISIRCSVGDTTSTQFSVCTSEPAEPTNSTSLIVIIAIILGIIFGIAGIVLLIKKKKKCCKPEETEVAALAAVRSEQVNGKEGPETPLTGEEETTLTRRQTEDAPLKMNQ